MHGRREELSTRLNSPSACILYRVHIVLTGYYFYRADTDKHTRMIHTHAHTDSTSIRNASHKMHDVVVTSLALPQTLTHSQTTPLVIHSSSHGVQ